MTIKDKNLQWTIAQTKNLISGSGFMDIFISPNPLKA